VAIHREVHQKYSQELENAFSADRGIPSKARALLVNDPEEGKKRLGDLISDVADPVFQRYQEELGERSGAIDQPENYRSINALCDHW